MNKQKKTYPRVSLFCYVILNIFFKMGERKRGAFKTMIFIQSTFLYGVSLAVYEALGDWCVISAFYPKGFCS